MTYDEALQFIHSANKFGSKLGLENITNLLNEMNNPQEKLKIIHIAGTNGKGSTASFMNQVLLEEKYEVGLFTSPYLEIFNERIRVNNILISDEELACYIDYIKNIIDIMIKKNMPHPTEFEIITALAFKYFLDKKVDFVILEVGLGGRFDATNVIKKSIASVITSISLDHTHILGDTISKIAYEKAGIIKSNGIVFSYPQKEEAFQVLQQVSEDKKARLETFSEKRIKNIKMNSIKSTFDWMGVNEEKNIENIEIHLLGEHQIYNASLALYTLEDLEKNGYLNLSIDSIKNGLKNTKWNGRLEILQQEPVVMIDGAHNYDGALALANTIESCCSSNKSLLCIGILGDKDIKSILDTIIPKFDTVIVTQPNNPRALDAIELAKQIEKYNINFEVEPCLNQAIKLVNEKINDFDLIVFSGSLYLIGEVRSNWKLK